MTFSIFGNRVQRKKEKEPESSDDPIALREEILSKLPDGERQDVENRVGLLLPAMKGIPLIMLQAYIMKELGEKSYKEIATIQKRPISAVQKDIHLTAKCLSLRLKNKGPLENTLNK